MKMNEVKDIDQGQELKDICKENTIIKEEIKELSITLQYHCTRSLIYVKMKSKDMQ